MTKVSEKAELEAKKLTVKIEKIQKERSNAERVISSMMKKHNCIESERETFGAPGGF